MKLTILLCLMAMLLTTGISVSCDDGFFVAPNADGDDICY